jgi:hypothetical protein
MTCPSCEQFDAAERASIEGGDVVSPHKLDACTCNFEPLIAVTLLGPERLPLAPQRGLGLGVTWGELVRWIAEPIVTDDKASAGGFVLARLRNGVRRAAHVESVSALALEHDAGTMTPLAAHERLHKYRHVVYSTWSSTPECPRWRAIIAVSRPMTPDEYRLVWSRAARVVERDAPVDKATKDPCRLWYLPTLRPGAEHIALVGDGSALEVDRAIAAFAARATPTYVAAASTTTGGRYVETALARECAQVASAPDGARNVALNRAAYALARLHISTIEIADALLRAAIRAGLPEPEARKTITSALKARRGRA